LFAFAPPSPYSLSNARLSQRPRYVKAALGSTRCTFVAKAVDLLKIEPSLSNSDPAMPRPRLH
jgi:hypothetical protein